LLNEASSQSPCEFIPSPRAKELTMSSIDQKYDAAIELQQQGKLDEAIGKLEEVIEQDPAYALAHAGLGKFYSDLERYEEAIQHAQKVCELEPDDPFSFTALSIVCQKAGRMAEAEEAMAQAVQLQFAARPGQAPG
jgi:tetratricopeptide (TPR) repeat protein